MTVNGVFLGWMVTFVTVSLLLLVCLRDFKIKSHFKKVQKSYSRHPRIVFHWNLPLAIGRIPCNSINNITLSATCSCRTATPTPIKMLLNKSPLIATGSLSRTSSRMAHAATLVHLRGFPLLGPCVREALPPSVMKSFAQDPPVPLPWGPPDPGPLSHSVSCP